MPLLIQISLHYRPVAGGQEVYIANLSRALAAGGWETKVVQPFRGEAAADTLAVPRIPGVARYVPGFEEWQFVAFSALRAAWLDRADVILCHYALTAALVARVPRWRRKAVVLSHGVEWNVDRMNRHDRARERNAKRLFGRVATVANDTDYLRRMGMDAPPGEGFFSEVAPGVWFIPNAVDTVRFSPGPPREPKTPGETIVLVPRQICEDRGIHLAIEAFARLAPRRPDAVLAVVGPKRSAAYFEMCRALVERHGLGDRVRFHPPVSNDGMVDWYRRAGVTLIPTLRREGTSLSALESMACGTPAVVTDVAGLRDLPARRCPPEAGTLADGLEAVLGEREEEAARQRRRVLDVFNLENWSAAWLAMLDRKAGRNNT